MVPIHGLHHIGLTDPDMDEATRFFETMFGAVTVPRVDGVDVDDCTMACCEANSLRRSPSSIGFDPTPRLNGEDGMRPLAFVAQTLCYK
jgi:hypothetical protein